MKSWPQHLKDFSKEHNIEFKEAMTNKQCKKEWRAMKKNSGGALDGDVDGDAVVDAAEPVDATAAQQSGGRRRRRKTVKKGGKSNKNKILRRSLSRRNRKSRK